MVELLIVMLLMGIVLVIASTSLVSFQNVTTRNSAMVTDEQAASTTLTLIGRDIRSAHSITFLSSSTNAANSVILYENQPSGSGTTPIEWVYQPPTGSATVGTFSRIVLNSSLVAQSTQLMLKNLANPTTGPVFTYYDLQDSPIPTTGTSANQTIQNCATAIGVTLDTSPSPIPGVATFQETAEVAITDQQQLLSAPGNGQC